MIWLYKYLHTRMPRVSRQLSFVPSVSAVALRDRGSCPPKCTASGNTPIQLDAPHTLSALLARVLYGLFAFTLQGGMNDRMQSSVESSRVESIGSPLDGFIQLNSTQRKKRSGRGEEREEKGRRGRNM